MKHLRLGLIIVPLAILAWVVVAVVLGSGTFSGARSAVGPSGPSPVCLPATLDHSAALDGTTVDVSPAPETDTANPHTQISFLGTPVTNIQDVSVVGSQSGYHYGHLYGYFQGDGGSFVPDEPFQEGERVAVNAVLQGAGAGRKVSFSFHIATPYPTDSIPEFPNPPAPPSSYQSFVSAPNVHPPIMAVTWPDRDPVSGDLLTTVGPGPGQFGPLIYTPQGRAGVVSAALGWQRRGEPQHAELRRRARPHLVAGARALARLRRGRRHRDERRLPDRRARARGNGFQADLHDFQLAPNQVAYITVYNPMRCDLTPVDGPRNGTIVDTAVQALDIKTGLVRWEWHSLDHVGVSESHATVPAKAQAGALGLVPPQLDRPRAETATC